MVSLKRDTLAFKLLKPMHHKTRNVKIMYFERFSEEHEKTGGHPKLS